MQTSIMVIISINNWRAVRAWTQDKNIESERPMSEQDREHHIENYKFVSKSNKSL